MSWKAACTVTDVESQSFKLFDVEGVPILIANIDGEWRAYPPVCPHMEEPLMDSGLCSKGKIFSRECCFVIASPGRRLLKVTVTKKDASWEFDANPDESVLYAGLRQGLNLPYECATGT